MSRPHAGSFAQPVDTGDELGPRVLVTGGAGFIGSHLAEALLDRGCSVSVLDDLSTGCLENLAGLRGRTGFQLTVASVLDATVLEPLVAACDTVFHLAAAVGVQLILDQPVATIESNVLGTEVILRLAAKHGARTVLTSSSEVYGKGNGLPFSEDDDVLLGPSSRCRWSYATSKLAGEFLALAYHKEKALNVTVARLFNTVGPRQTGRYGMVVPRFVQQALHGEPLTVYGDGTQSRCFLHVADAVEALLLLAASPRCVGEVYNVGSTQELTILELARKVLAFLESRGISSRACESIRMVPYEQAYSAGFEDMQRRLPDVAKLRAHTGWTRQHDLEDVLEDVLKDVLDCLEDARA